jgi:SAM-dependent methyltransferase
MDYVHGYAAREGIRLSDQAMALADLLHAGTSYGPGSRVLEVGCGTGAQTVILAGRSPAAEFTSVDVSERSVAEAERRVRLAGCKNVRFLRGDVYRLPFEPASFDHVFVCFVLEHLRDPPRALQALMTVLKPGGSLTVIEGDHGSAYFHPASDRARQVIQCLIDLQQQAGGDSLIGRRLYPLLVQAGCRAVQVTPLVAYVDGSRPDLADAITLKTFTAMVEGVADQAVRQGLIDAVSWSAGIGDLRRTAETDGAFCYTFFKAVALR